MNVRFLLIGLVAAGTVSAAAIGISAVTTITTGGTFSIDVVVGSIVDLYAYQFDVTFNPAILSATGIAAGPFLSGGTGFIPGIIDNLAGTVQFTADTLFGPVSGISGSGTLATFQFSALAVGSSPIVLSNLVFLDSNLRDITIDAMSNGMVTVTAVPEPRYTFLTALLMCSAVALRRNRLRTTVAEWVLSILAYLSSTVTGLLYHVAARVYNPIRPFTNSTVESAIGDTRAAPSASTPSR
jgi:hypothetical protein